MNANSYVELRELLQKWVVFDDLAHSSHDATGEDLSRSVELAAETADQPS